VAGGTLIEILPACVVPESVGGHDHNVNTASWLDQAAPFGLDWLAARQKAAAAQTDWRAELNKRVRFGVWFVRWNGEAGGHGDVQGTHNCMLLHPSQWEGHGTVTIGGPQVSCAFRFGARPADVRETWKNKLSSTGWPLTPEASHLCHLPVCANPLCLVVEPAYLNSSRNYCFGPTSTEEPYSACACHKRPPCTRPYKSAFAFEEFTFLDDPAAIEAQLVKAFGPLNVGWRYIRWTEVDAALSKAVRTREKAREQAVRDAQRNIDRTEARQAAAAATKRRRQAETKSRGLAAD